MGAVRPHLVVLGSGLSTQLPLGVEPGDVLVTVRDRATAVEAVLAAVQGHRVVASVVGPPDLADGLYRDLRRIGPVEVRQGEAVDTVGLPAQVWAVLDEVAAGRSLDDVAQSLHVSRRTVDRRLAQARRELGVGSTTEAVLAHRSGGPGLTPARPDTSPA